MEFWRNEHLGLNLADSYVSEVDVEDKAKVKPSHEEYGSEWPPELKSEESKIEVIEKIQRVDHLKRDHERNNNTNCQIGSGVDRLPEVPCFKISHCVLHFLYVLII